MKKNNTLILVVSLLPIVSMQSMHAPPTKEIEFITAVKEGDRPKVTRLLSEGVSANTQSPETKIPALFIAITKPDLTIFELLLKHGADLNEPKKTPLEGITCLHAVVYYSFIPDRDKKIQLLLAHNADVNAQDLKGDTPLNLVIRNENSILSFEQRQYLIPMFLKAGVDIHHQNKDRVTGLAMAIQKKDKDAVLFLLTNKVKAPSFTYGDMDMVTKQYRHALSLTKDEEDSSQKEKQPEHAKSLRAIGRALIQYEGLFTNHSRIAKHGLAQTGLPIDVLKIIAMHCEYPSLQEDSTKEKT